jgi:hypothetical protein
MLTRTMTILMAATLAGGLFASDAQARGGGGGGHGGGFGGGGHVGGFGGGHIGGFGGVHMSGGFGSARVGSHFGGTRMGGGFGREFHRYGGYRSRHGYAYGTGGLDCSPYDWQYQQQWPYSCY